MGEYVYTVICAAVCTAVVIVISPDGEEGGVGKYIAFAGAVVIALTMISPITELLNGTEYDFKIPEEKTQTDTLNIGKYYSESAGSVLSSLYGVDRSEITAMITEDDSGSLSKINLIIKEPFSFDEEEAGKMLSQIYKIKFEITGESDG